MKFYDTSALLTIEDFSDIEKPFYISSITLVELEHIKISNNKSDEIKYAGRKVLNFLIDNEGKYYISIYNHNCQNILSNWDYLDNNDLKILACFVESKCDTFITNDLALYAIAKSLALNVERYIPKEKPIYTGYKEVSLEDEDLSFLYAEPTYNSFDLLDNQYLIVNDSEDNFIDVFKWHDNKMSRVNYTTFDSSMFGRIKPKDIYQQCAMDSLKNNQITLLGGPAGSGKTCLALGYLFNQLEKHYIDRIVIMCNPVGAKNAAKLGFYKGTVQEKLLSTQVGHVLASKFGDIQEVERLIDDRKLAIIPVVDARGCEISSNDALYVLESQNLTSDLLRLILQRSGEETKIIVDGDRFEQLDLDIYVSNNGMKRMSEVFRGYNNYGQVDLKEIYRSPIAKLAEKMK